MQRLNNKNLPITKLSVGSELIQFDNRASSTKKKKKLSEISKLLRIKNPNFEKPVTQTKNTKESEAVVHPKRKGK